MHDFSIRNQSCHNPRCIFFQKGNSGKIVIHSRKNRRLRCSFCKRTWVAHVGSFSYRLKTDPRVVEEALQKLTQGFSIRHVAHLCRASPTSVYRWKLRYLKQLRTSF